MEETRNETEMQKTKVFNVVNYHGRLADEAFDKEGNKYEHYCPDKIRNM